MTVLSTKARNILPSGIILLLAAAVAAGYLNTLHSPFVLDDESNIVHNGYIQIQDLGPASLRRVFSPFNTLATRPVANLSFALNYLAGGLDTTGYHLVNILIHYCTALVVFRLFVWYLRRAGVAGERGTGPIGTAGAGALLWAANPIQTSAVTYIVQRMTSLCTLFFLSSLLVYLLARDLPGATPRGQAGRKGAFLLASFALWVLAMLTKEIAAIMPAILILHEAFFFDQLSRTRMARKKYYYLAAVLLPILAGGWYLAGGGWQAIMGGYQEREFTLGERLLTEPRAVLRYLTLFLLPLPGRMTMFYEYPVSRGLLNPPATLFSILALAQLVLTACLAARRYPLIAFGIFWTLLCLLIESSVVPLELIFEHRFYLPAVGFSLAVTVALTEVFNRLNLRREVAFLFWLGVGVLLVALTGMRNQAWRDSISIHLDGARKAPQSLRAVNGLGVAYLRAGKEEQAAQALQQALAIAPRNVVPLANLFLMYSESSRNQEAEPYLDRIKASLAAGAFRCTEAGNISLMTEELVRRQRYAEVIGLLEALARCDASRTPTYFDNLGLSYAQLDQHVKAAENFRKALALDPDNPYILLSLARSCLLLGDKKNANLALDRLQGVALPPELGPPLAKIKRYLNRP